MLLAGRVRIEDLDVLPDQISNFQYLSVLGCGAVPPNPAELLSRNTFSLILRQLKGFYDVIIVDTPPAATYHSDIISIASVAGSALVVARCGSSRMEETRHLMALLSKANANAVGAVLNQY
jgi:tyrosine-protein kinase Etk/Wzc